MGIGQEMRFGDDIALRDLSRGAVVHDHVHAREAAGGDIHLLPKDGDRHAGGFGCLQKKGSRAAGRIIDRLARAGGPVDARNSSYDARHLSGGVELTLGFACLCRKVAHEVFVGIAQDVIVVGAVLREVQLFPAEYVDQRGQGVDHLLAAPKLFGIVEESPVDHAAEIVLLGDASYDRVHPFADVLGPTKRLHV